MTHTVYVWSFLFVFVAAFVNVGRAVKINRLKVPQIIKHGSEAILDCDFSIDESDSDLVVKWYFNKTLVYQWIPSTKMRPQGLGILKDRLNLEYQASVDVNSIHRALHILKAGPDLSGNYTCSVSTLEGEDIRTKSMLVLVSEKFFELKRVRADDGYIKVQCLADGVFPKPVMSLHSQEREITEAVVTSRQIGHLYEISAIATLPALEKPEEFSCKLHIPQANYTTRRETVFYPGNGAVTESSARWLTISLCSFSLYAGLRATYLGGGAF
ncbi:uncharacterized protein LOC132699494 [Cylas formicarius]|uniref:uncharacterized protein LOC132699494 n=1 Tax=Cylas formicarius TaxID=197179 RepID=UPI0029587588|nr:uncharacterized protein LOC132699494 [Cylas formicarius]